MVEDRPNKKNAHGVCQEITPQKALTEHESSGQCFSDRGNPFGLIVLAKLDDKAQYKASCSHDAIRFVYIDEFYNKEDHDTPEHIANP